MAISVLVINCGSSSIKYALISERREDRIYGLAENLGAADARIKGITVGGEALELSIPYADHAKALETLLERLANYNPQAIGHRVVHGGNITQAERLTQQTIDRIRDAIPLAPLHNPANLIGIEATMSLFPQLPQVAVFDTAFHQTMPPHAFMYAIPYALYKKYGIRRYGFHGTSHRYVSERAIEILGLDVESSKIITCHLGNGASVCAIKNGQSVDTSMGFTPVEGLIMGTRSGDIDMGAVTYIMDKEKIGTKSASVLFNKHSGLLGISGLSSDSRDIREAAYEKGDERAMLAIDMFNYRIKKYIGSYAAAMGGIDALVFTGGIGENSDITRSGICEELGFMGVEIDENLNNGLRGKEQLISKSDAKVKVLVVPTNEELMIANDTMEIVRQ